MTASCFGGIVEVMNASAGDLRRTVETTLMNPRPAEAELAADIPDTAVDKYDHFLPKPMRDLGYGAKYFDVDGAWNWLSGLHGEIRPEET